MIKVIQKPTLKLILIPKISETATKKKYKNKVYPLVVLLTTKIFTVTLFGRKWTRSTISKSSKTTSTSLTSLTSSNAPNAPEKPPTNHSLPNSNLDIFITTKSIFFHDQSLCRCSFLCFIFISRIMSSSYSSLPIRELKRSSPNMRSMPDYFMTYWSRFMNFSSFGLYLVIWRSYLSQSKGSLRSGYSDEDLSDDPEDDEDEEEDFRFFYGFFYLRTGLFFLVSSYFLVTLSFSLGGSTAASLRMIFSSFCSTFLIFSFSGLTASFSLTFSTSFLLMTGSDATTVVGGLAFSIFFSGFSKGLIIFGRYSFFFGASDELMEGLVF